MSQDVTYNVTGQSLVFDAPEGLPSSVTSVGVFSAGTGDDGTAETATTGSASLETATTLDASAGISQANRKLIPVAATGIAVIGRKYLVTNATAESEWVELAEIDSGVSVTARHPLQNDYASGDAFESTRISISVDSTWVAESNNISDDLDPNPGYRVRWEYVVGGVTYVHDTYFDLVRYAGAHSVTALDVDRYSPGWQDKLPVEYREDRGQALIDAAHEEVILDLHGRDIPDEMIRSERILNALVVRKSVQLAADAAIMSGGQNTIARDIALDAYQGLFDRLVAVSSKTPLATGTGGGSARVATEGFWSK